LNLTTNLTDGLSKKLLHFAPETEFADKFKRMKGVDYLSADLGSPHAMVQMDITDIDFPDSSLDIIICSHILEHVHDDCRAIREMFRVLIPGGWAMIQVPIGDGPTKEDPSIIDPAERERLFWKSDHVRLYGLDIEKRLVEGGFDVKVVFGHELVKPQDFEKMGIFPDDPIFHCIKPAA
jgi:SAM-dependent methyltransferase